MAPAESSASTPPGNNATLTTHPRSTNPELDLAKLRSLPPEQQELFLLTFVNDLSRHVHSLSAEDCTAQQFYLKREVFQILKLPSPAPSRVVRNNLGRCLATFLSRGDRKLLFETINELVALIGGGSKAKSDADLRTRHAAACCLGDVFAAAGDSAIGLHQLACTTLAKLLKSSQNNAGLRAAALGALAKIVGMVGASLDEVIARDIWKQARTHASGDKGWLVVVSACRLLKSLVRDTPYFLNSTDFDKLETAVFKAVDSPSPQVRHAGADCFAEALVQGFSGAPPTSAADGLSRSKSKRAKSKPIKRQPTGLVDEDEVSSRPQSPAPSGKKQVIALSFAEMLKILSNQYVRSSTSNRTRAAIGVCYGKLMRRLGEKVVESHYLTLVESMAVDILGHNTIANNRYRLLISRRIVETVLQDIVGNEILGEPGQIESAASLINSVLKNYPQALPERPEPSKSMLITVLGALSSLINSLGSASNKFAEACRDSLLQVLPHPSYAVQVYTAACMKSFALNCPQQLLPCLTICMNSLSRELSHLGTGRSSPRRCIGFAHGLAATLSASPQRPLYGSVDVNSRVLTMATNLLKSSGQSELRVSSTQIQVAWILIGGLMSLGPNFVKIHLSQLLLLWKNALPKPLARDNTSSRSLLEASFLAHVRECALGSILAFLQFNQRLLTVDVCKRIATMLQNTTSFIKTLPSKKTTDDISQRLIPALQLQDIDMMVQRRVLQCYIKLVTTSPAGGAEALLQSNLLTLAVALFADPENYAANSLSSSIASAAGTFETIWDIGDNSGFGVAGLVRGFNVRSLPGQHENMSDVPALDDGSPEEAIDRLLLSPICGSIEHDASQLYLGAGGTTSDLPPDPPATEVINMAIQLFAFVFPLAPGKVQESILEQIKTFSSAGPLQRDPGRKAAINVNVSAAILSTLRVAVKETSCPPGDITNVAVERLLQDTVRDTIIDPDPYVRSMGYAAVARLCSACGTGFTNHEIKYLVDTIVINREPSARAGCAMSLGAIQSKAGGMSSGYQLKTILGILMSLCNDPHPTVHYWALEALRLASDAAGLGFSPYVPSTLGMLAQLYSNDTHNPEIASAISMNLEMEVSTPAVIARSVDSLINVLGPDLQDSTKSRELILCLVSQFQGEEELLVQRASLGCLEHLSLYAPGHMVFAEYVGTLQKYLNCEDRLLRDAAVDALYNLMRRDPRDVISAAEKGFEEQLWLVLDNEPSHDGIRNIIRNWMRQTCLKETALWLQRFQAVLRMTRAKVREDPSLRGNKKTATLDLQDEEVAGFAASSGAGDEKGGLAGGADVEPLRWQVTTFAMECMNDIFIMVSKDIIADDESESQAALQNKIADVVRMAFSASTSSVLELRIWGLKIIGAVLKMFGKTPDPDFEEAMLLEQYQAQISSALTPAFAADSSAELASEAVNVCASFIATGIVTDIDRMGRILKTLVTGLENFAKDGGENVSIGDLKGLTPNAQVMVKMSVFAAWAELQVASSEQKYLLDVLRPHIATLTPLWLESLREFSRLRFEPDISMTLGPPSLSGSLDTIYAALNRETLLRFYQDVWLKLVDAIASLIEQDSDFVFDALDGKASGGPPTNGGSSSRGADINYRDEPVAFFFVLFGIAFEALATRPGQSGSLQAQEQTLSILQALRKILHPSVSGQAIFREAVFSETMDLLDRLVLTEGLDVQSVIVEIARALCVAHPSARKKGDAEEAEEGGDLSEDIEQLFELTRIIVLVLSGLLPTLGEGNQPARHQMTDEAVLLVGSSLDALVDAAEAFPSVIKTDLHACIVHIFSTILATQTQACQELIVPQALPTLKRFVAGVASRSRASGVGGADVQLQGCLRRFMAVYLRAQRREEQTSLACVKNSLLASTILFTAGRNGLPATDGVVARYLEEVLDCLTDRMTSKMAANCIRSLLLTSSPTPADHSITRYLFPRLVTFITATEPEDPTRSRAIIAQTLTQYITLLSRGPDPVAGGRLAAGMSVLIAALLSRARGDGEDSYPDTKRDLLALAGAEQRVFRAVVAELSGSQRAFLEGVIRSGKVGGEAKAEEGGEAPAIALKMDFGS
ncbi:related to rat omega-conotoxin-sensitive calcium channel alpha-1 subunit rbB-I [Cephalotrichum gorgonifer]|uniref:Related to rat omega-conotoxin-sensitive calcium channel alpha-1 subunit rbB-I n=1 Tax=Cephalotrichum gorgonifer TaxID=2041049 RepID=A0AAE8MZU7_9PEZI|nr:related to rat omega-conotoxin-sensitive calcium channel alpha-1 subunit rbB-I [Cephalotrichum gorgonifer]